MSKITLEKYYIIKSTPSGYIINYNPVSNLLSYNGNFLGLSFRSALAEFPIPLNPDVTRELLKNKISVDDLSEIKTLYITPNSVVPRYRLKEIKEKYNIQVTRDPKKAGHRIIGATAISGDISTIYGTYFTYSCDILNNLYPKLKEYIDSGNKRFYAFYTNLENLVSNITVDLSQKVVTILDYSFYKNATDFAIAIGTNVETLLTRPGYESNQFMCVNDDFIEILNILDQPFIIDTEFVSKLGESKFNEDTFNFIVKLFKSDDANDRSLAVTMMSNTNFDESLPYLLLLYQQFSGEIELTSKSVSVKSLLNFLNQFRLRSVDDVISVLDNKKRLTPEIISLILKTMADLLLHKQVTILNSKRIQISKLELEIK